MNRATIESPLATGASSAGGSMLRGESALLVLSLLWVAALATSSGTGFGRIAVLIGFAPLAEEAVFRAGLQEALLRRQGSALVANGLTALAFGLAHVLVRGDAGAFVLAAPALLIGAVYGRWRRLRLCVALHAALNAAWLAWAAVGPATPWGL